MSTQGQGTEVRKKGDSVAHGASRMGLATLMSRFMGLGRELVFAYLFGASNAADAFNIAFRIPNLLRDLFAEGAMSAAFVPNFTRALITSRKRAFELLAGVLVVLVLITSVLATLGVVFTPQIVRLYAGSYASVPGKIELAMGLTRSMFPFFPMVAMAAVLMGALNALGFFFLPAFAPVLFNITSIVCGLTVVPLLEHFTSVPPIYGMALAVVVGGFLQFYVQFAQIRREGFRLSEEWAAVRHPFKVEGVKTVLWLLIPGTIGLAATQLGILINSVYATRSGAGAVSWLNYAFRLMQFPIGIFGVSLAAATLPAVSRKLAQNDREGAGLEVSKSLRMTFAINGPAAAGLMVVGLPIVQLLFQHGRFHLSDAQNTAAAVFWYGVGLPGYSAVKVLVPVFYALGSTRVPVIASFLMVLLNAVLNHIFIDRLHYPFWSLAIATSSTATLNALGLFFWLSTVLPGVVNAQLARAFLLHTIVSLAVGLGAAGTIRLMGPLEPTFATVWGGRFVFWGLEVALAIFVAGLLWWGLGRILKIEENEKTAGFILKKLRRTR